jgi:hypothetical protein
MKLCSKCKTEKTLIEFRVYRQSRDGLFRWCKACEKAYKSTPEQLQKGRDRNRARYQEDSAVRERIKAYVNNRYHTDPAYQADVKARARARELDPVTYAHIKALARSRYQAGYRAKDLARRTPTYKARKLQREYERLRTDPAYKAQRRHSLKTHKYRRRAWIEQSQTSYTQQEWDEICQKYGHRCLRCHEAKPLTPDHVMPLSRGGSNAIENIQPLCLDCNRWKRDQTIDYRLGEGS